jgi:hypothetical protein
MKYDDMDELERETALKVWREVTGGSPVGASMADLERASETVLWHRWVLAERLHIVGQNLVDATPRPADPASPTVT